MSTATAHAEPQKLGKRRIEELRPAIQRTALLAGVIGVLIVVLSTLTVPAFRERLAASYLVAFTYYLGITLGAVWFVVLQHLVKAGWSVVVRRVAEGLAMNMVVLIPALLIPVIVLMHMGHLHPWAAHGGGDHGVAAAHGAPVPGEHAAAPGGEGEHAAPGGEHAGDAHHAVHQTTDAPGSQALGAWSSAGKFDLKHLDDSPSRKSWLSLYAPPGIDPVRPPGFLWRMLFYVAIWAGIAVWFRARSVEQDTTGEVALTSRMEWWSAPCMLAFGLSTAMCGFDLVMSLDPKWYSTMFGVYFFAGSVLSFFAVMILSFVFLQKRGLVQEVSPEHYHDLGKLMFAFVVFWAYIGFSQFMLIWYGNIPEEVAWFQRRMDNGWMAVSMWLVIGHFVIPFFALLSRFGKRRPPLLAIGAGWILFVHYIDVMWLILPEPEKNRAVPIPLLDLGLFLSLGAAYVYFTARNLSGASLIPERDPRLAVSLAHENF